MLRLCWDILNPTDAVRKKVFDEDRGISKMETPSGTQQTTLVTGKGQLYIVNRLKKEFTSNK